MHKLLQRRSLVVKNKVSLKKKESVIQDKENSVIQDKENSVIEDKEKSAIQDKEELVIQDKEESILKLICLYQLENNLLIDEIIPNIAFKFSKIGKVKIEFYQSELTLLTDDSIYTWDIKNNSYKSNNIEISVFNEKYTSKNFNNLTIILVDNEQEINKYFLMHNYSVLVENKDNTNKIIIDKKNNSYNIFNPFILKPNEIINDYDFYTISKQNLIKKMLIYKLNEISANQKENYKLFVKCLDYLSINSELKNQYKSEFEKIEKNKIQDFLKKINQHFRKQYSI